jgi:hypothetical protein
VEYHRSAPYKKPRIMRCPTTRVLYLMAWDKKEEAQGPHGSRGKRSPKPPAPRAKEVARNST